MKMIILVVLIISSALFAFGCSRNLEDRADKMVNRISSKLELTDVQVIELTKIKNKALEIHQNYKKNKESRFSKVKSILLQNQISEDQVKEMINNKRQRIDSILPKIMPDILKFHKQLSSEQKQKLVKLLEKFKKKFSKYHK